MEHIRKHWLPITPLTAQGQNWFLKMLIVNGRTLVDNTGTDYDLMKDSPTQNWATGNPLFTQNANPDLTNTRQR